MGIVKLTESEIKELVEVIAMHCYKSAQFEYLNGCRVSLFDFSKIKQIVDESFFEILQRFEECEDEIHIEACQRDEIYELIIKELEGYYEFYDLVNFYEAREDYEYNRNPKIGID